jgi:hypothetical protein
MKQAFLAIALAICPWTCVAQERGAAEQQVEMSRAEWQARVEASRQRLELMRREGRSFIPAAPTSDEIAEEASKQVLEDDSLRRGDIVSTNRGLFRFNGSPDKERSPDDFVRIR